jgi:hypothetical protein
MDQSKVDSQQRHIRNSLNINNKRQDCKIGSVYWGPCGEGNGNEGN